MAKTETLKFKRTVQATPEAAYQMFASGTTLSEWLCDQALVEPRKGGRLYLAWNSGYYTVGRYTKTDPGKKIAFTWHGPGEPEPTEVRVSFSARGDATTISLTHDGLGRGKKWSAAAEEIARGWETALGNLQAALETGEDLRFTMRPMLGVSGLEPMTPKIAEEIGAGVSRGLRLDGTVEGMGAAAAGLQSNDVIVSLDGARVDSVPAAFAVLQRRRAGDVVPVVFYRGADKHTADMTLSKRPLPEVPATPEALAGAVRQIFNDLDTEMDQILAGVTEEEAGFRPGGKEWSVKDVLAHLIHGERDNLSYVLQVLSGHEPIFDGFVGNVPLRNQATLDAYPTLADLRQELRRLQAETVALLRAMPPEYAARKAGFWRTGFLYLQGPLHNNDHLNQMRAAIVAARAG